MKAPVAIVGGGIAGLTAATALRRAGVPFTLYEAGSQLGGLARTAHDADGFAYDFGAHFVTNRLAAAVGVGAQCYDVKRYGESVLVGSRSISYPLGLLSERRYVASAARRRFRDAFERPQLRSAADWFESRYGHALAHEVALPLLEAWSGLPASELSAAVANQMPDSILRTLWLKIAGLATRKAVASGYCLSQRESMHVWHVYPWRGVATLCERMGEKFPDAIEYDSGVSAVYVDSGRVVGLRVNDCDIEASAVVSSVPLDVLAPMVRGSAHLEPLSRFMYRPMIFVNVRFTGRGLLPDIVLWTPGNDVPFFRLTEAPAAMASLAPANMTTVTCDIGANVGDHFWKMEDDAIGDLCVEHLAGIIPDVRARYRGVRVMRTPIAYPVFALKYESVRRQFAIDSGVAGLHLIGRNGTFRHDLMEDVYWRTRHQALRIVEEFRADDHRFDESDSPASRSPYSRPPVAGSAGG